MECGKPHLILRSFNPFISLLFRLFHLPPLGQVAIVVGTKGNPRPQRGNLGNFNLKKKKNQMGWSPAMANGPDSQPDRSPFSASLKSGTKEWRKPMAKYETRRLCLSAWTFLSLLVADRKMAGLCAPCRPLAIHR